MSIALTAHSGDNAVPNLWPVITRIAATLRTLIDVFAEAQQLAIAASVGCTRRGGPECVTGPHLKQSIE